jgi:dihydrofolate synthase/folylpolyglutamate synthase
MEFKEFLDDLYKLTLSHRGIIRKNYNLTRIKRLLEKLGNPQKQLRAIHIAGTSGKGSTATILASLLSGQGFKTGLFISPHIIDICERMQINNIGIPMEELIKLYLEVKPVIIEINKSQEQEVTFFETLTVIAFLYFNSENVDYVVIETGVGGIIDPTNVLESSNKIAVITKIGFDHMDLLGKTLPLIASQKAGIIHPQNICITTSQKPQVSKVLSLACKTNRSSFIQLGNQFKYKINKDRTFNYSYKGHSIDNIRLSLLGEYQKENCSLALTTLLTLASRDHFNIDISKIRHTLSNILFLARFSETSINGNKVIIDGAHNPQKMAAFTKAIKKHLPDQKFDFIIAFKKGKDYRKILKYIIPLANKIYISNFQINTQGFKIESEDKMILSDFIEKLGFSEFEIINSQEIKSLIKSKKATFVITGSLYFIADLINNHKLISNNQN